MNFSGRFEGKSIVVTGAAQGIGLATAQRAAHEGGKVVFVDRSDLVDEHAEAAGGIAIKADLETSEGAQAAIAFALRSQGRVDILINCVGGAIRMRPFAEFEPEQIEAEIRRSLMPTLWCCHAVIPFMLSKGHGTIVNVSSNATRGIRRVPYSAAKGGINALTQSLAMEYSGQGIRVCATAPGGTLAPERRIPRNPDGDDANEQAWMAEAVEQVTRSAFMQRYGTMDEQVAPILFLASDEASYITGTVLPVAGGDLG